MDKKQLEKMTTMTVPEALFEFFRRLDELESVLTELQVFLNAEGILPGVHYFGEDDSATYPQTIGNAQDV
jgi:hypothetical protein